MPAYYNPNNFLPATYMTPGMYQPTRPQQSFTQQSAMADADLIMKWVQGEVGAKAFQMPQGWPAGRPIPLWDSTQTVIWVKSWNQIGAPNPLQKINYVLENQSVPTLPTSGAEANPAQSEAAPEPATDEKQFATKEDIEALRNEIRNYMRPQRNNQNESNYAQNRGGNK